jgi:hypothetical protein
MLRSRPVDRGRSASADARFFPGSPGEEKPIMNYVIYLVGLVVVVGVVLSLVGL